MHSQSAAIVRAARACVGTRFRPQGRTIGVGLDCVGVALAAAAAAGIRIETPAYVPGGDNEARLDHAVASLGWILAEQPEAGDIIVFAPATGRRHVAVATDNGIVHAHAGLRRVVEGPCDPAWTLIAAWRFPEG